LAEWKRVDLAVRRLMSRLMIVEHLDVLKHWEDFLHERWLPAG
jgi:hypothetical protein